MQSKDGQQKQQLHRKESEDIPRDSDSLSARGSDLNMQSMRQEPGRESDSSSLDEEMAIPSSMSSVDSSGQPLTYDEAKNTPEGAKAFVKKKPVLVEHTGGKGETSLHYAVAHGDIHMAQAIMDKYPEFIEAKDKDGKTPMHYAAENGNVEIATMLFSSTVDFLRNTQDLTILNAQDNQGRTPLHYAAENLNQEMGDFLVKKLGADKTIQDNNGKTANQLGRTAAVLALAKQGDFNKVLPSYLSKDPSLVFEKDKDGKTMLDYAVENGHPQVVQAIADFCTEQSQKVESPKINKKYKKELDDLRAEQDINKLEAAQQEFSSYLKTKKLQIESPQKTEKDSTRRLALEKDVELITTQLAIVSSKIMAANALDRLEEARANLDKMAAAHTPTTAPLTSTQASGSQDKNSYTPGKFNELKFTPSINEEPDFNKDGKRAMSDPKKSHVVEHQNRDGTFSYSITKVAGDDSPTKIHKVEGDFGVLIFNAQGEMIDAALKDGGKGLGQADLAQAVTLDKKRLEATKTRSSSIDLGVPPTITAPAGPAIPPPVAMTPLSDGRPSVAPEMTPAARSPSSVAKIPISMTTKVSPVSVATPFTLATQGATQVSEALDYNHPQRIPASLVTDSANLNLSRTQTAAVKPNSRPSIRDIFSHQGSTDTYGSPGLEQRQSSIQTTPIVNSGAPGQNSQTKSNRQITGHS